MNTNELEFETNLMINEESDDPVQNAKSSNPAHQQDKDEVEESTNRIASATNNSAVRNFASYENLDAAQAEKSRPHSSDDSRCDEEHLNLSDHFKKVSEKISQKVANLLMKCNTESNEIICRLKESMDKNAKMHENQNLRLEQEKKDLECTVTELKNNIIELKRKASDAKGKPICCGCNGIVDSVFYCTTQCLENHTK